MAGTKAEDDDDVGFGDFEFASFPNHTVIPFQINSRNYYSTTDNNDDDEWGDFVEHPLRSELPSGSSHAQSPPHPSEPSKPFDPFGFFSDNSMKPSHFVETSIESVPNAVESGRVQWVKPKGALPLSLFGDADEEQSGVDDQSVGDAKDSFADKRVASNVKNGSNINVGVEINDLIANLYKSQQIKDENGLISNSKASISNLNRTNWDSMNGSILNLGGLNSKSDLAAGNKDLDIITNLNNQSQHIKTENEFHFNLNGLDSNFNASSSNLNGLNLDFNGLNSNSHSVGGNERLDADDDGWEFKDADSEPKVEDGNNEGHVVSEFLGFGMQSMKGQEMQVEWKVQESSEVTTHVSGFDNGLNGSIDLFASSNGSSSISREMDNGFDFKPSTVAQNGFISDPFFRSQQNDTENRLESHTVGNADSGESFWGFKAAFSEAGLKQEEEPKINSISHSEAEILIFDGKNQGNLTGSENHKGALPLSIFGDEELETVGSLNIQDVFTYKPASYPRNVDTQGSNISINDLISNLYGQAGQIPSVDSQQTPTKNGLDSTDMVFDSNLVDGDDDVDDGSWEFEDANSQTIAKDHTSLLSHGDALQNFAIKLELNNYVDFYSKLKDKLCFLARSHLDSLKNAQSTAALSGEDAKAAALDEEIQEACMELHPENMISKEAHAEDNPPIDICLNEFIEVLHEPRFQVLELEYHLSRRLSLAERDLRSAIELMKHVTTMLKILTFGSAEEQFIYVSAWSRMISVCAQELKHGARIWKESLEKNVQSRILSEPRGKRFILALGEIYKVVVVLEASAKLYKPWILSSSVDSSGICALLEECHTLWSSSGLEEALPSISDPVGFEDDRTAMALLESIKYIRDLDALSLGNLVFTHQDSVCQLSVLSPGVIPDMKMVEWNGEHYFLTLANLWANLISCDPPKLPRLHVG